MVKHKISWRNAGEIPAGFLQEILQLIMEKSFYLYRHCRMTALYVQGMQQFHFFCFQINFVDIEPSQLSVISSACFGGCILP